MHFHIPSISLSFSLSIEWDRARIRVRTFHIHDTSHDERYDRRKTRTCASGAICWLASPPVRADEVNRPRDKGWRLTSAVIRLCGSATMVIERDNEQPDVPAEMRRRNAGFIVATFSEHDSSALRGNSWWCSRECSRDNEIRCCFEYTSKLLHLIKSFSN